MLFKTCFCCPLGQNSHSQKLKWFYWTKWSHPRLQEFLSCSPWRGTVPGRSSHRSSSPDRWRPRSSRTESHWGTPLEVSRSGSTGGTETLDRSNYSERESRETRLTRFTTLHKPIKRDIFSPCDKLFNQQGITKLPADAHQHICDLHCTSGRTSGSESPQPTPRVWRSPTGCHTSHMRTWSVRREEKTLQFHNEHTASLCWWLL